MFPSYAATKMSSSRIPDHRVQLEVCRFCKGGLWCERVFFLKSVSNCLFFLIPPILDLFCASQLLIHYWLMRFCVRGTQIRWLAQKSCHLLWDWAYCASQLSCILVLRCWCEVQPLLSTIPDSLAIFEVLFESCFWVKYHLHRQDLKSVGHQ